MTRFRRALLALAFLLALSVSAVAQTRVDAGGNATVSLPAGQVLSVAADADSSGRVVRLADAAGADSAGATSVAAGATQTFGPYVNPTRFDVRPAAGFLTYSLAVYDIPAAIATAASSATFGGGAVAAVITGPNGTAALPTYSFTSDPNTGFFRSAADSLGFVTGGVERWLINASGALNCATDGGCDIGNGAADPRDLSLKRNLKLRGSSSGAVTLGTAAAAGTWTLQLPANDGDAGQVLQTDGAGVTTWVNSLHTTTVTLTDAQIKALPTTGVTLVPGIPGAVIRFHGALIGVHISGGSYTNIDAAGRLAFAVNVAVGAAIPNDSGGLLDQLLGGGADGDYWMVPPRTDPSEDWGALAFNMGSAAGAPLTVGAPNGASGNFTGGHAANTLTVTVSYTIVSAP